MAQSPQRIGRISPSQSLFNSWTKNHCQRGQKTADPTESLGITAHSTYHADCIETTLKTETSYSRSPANIWQ